MVHFFFTLLVGAAATQVSPVQKVIQLLDELKGKVESDLAKEESLMEEYTSWCDEEANTKEDAITSSKRTIGDLEATIEDAKATVVTLTSSIDELTTKISTSEKELADAKGIRDKEHEVFMASEKELVDTVDSLERALTVLKKNMALLQTGKMANVLGAMASGLQKVVEASWVSSHQKQVLSSLLQANAAANDGDEDLEAQPQGTSVSYESASGGILDTLADMQTKAEESLSSTRKDEMEAAHAFALLKQGLEDEIAVAKKQLSQATQTRSTTEEEQYAAETSLTETKETLAADEKYLEELKQSCSMKATEWAARQKQAGEETAAIEKAKEVLSEGVKVFLQTSARLRTKLTADGDDSRSQIVSILRRVSKGAHSYKLMQLVASAQSDPFGKIRGLIEEMIAKLTKEAAEEADQKSFCDEEISESKAKQADLSGKLDKTTARIAKAEADKAKLQEEIKVLENEIAEMDAGQAEATKVRQEEHAEYLTASKDYKDSAAAVAKAIDVLSEYYNSAAFVQVAARQPALGGAKSDVGSTIVSVLEVAESDFTSMLAEAEADESSAVEAYEKLTQGNAVTKATKTGAVKAKSSEVKQLEVAIGNYKENKATTTDELDAVMAYLDKLKPQCETKVMSYGERKAKREQEIQGLKEALTILSGEALLQLSVKTVHTTLRGARRS